MKYLVFILLMSLSLFAADRAETIEKIEMEKNAKCEYAYSGNSYCFNNYCRQNHTYNCLSNDSKFNVRLGVRYYNIGGRISNELVKKITFIY